jgi:hypothetical protein
MNAQQPSLPVLQQGIAQYQKHFEQVFLQILNGDLHK